ncbi:hypothetical protein DFH09DRAFT_1439965 [Mycena vulgaris]|nr:hypothetical protein DFH09DRAFT_1439965 [Mycena vulgaris]
MLTHVSSRWRAIVLSTSSLWSQIVINFSHPRSNPLNMVKTQIERAQKLSVYFQANGSQPPRPQIDMFRLLAEHSLRWQELDIELTSHISPLLSTLRNRVPFLHTIWIQWEDAASQDGVASVDCFQTAPSLLDVGIANIFRHVMVPLPAHQLTRYVLDAPWTVHEGILKSALNLVEARISVVFSQDWPNSSTAVNLPSLRRLYVVQSRILDYIRTPALEELGIWARKDYGRRVLPHFESFLVHSSCSLRRLCLRGLHDTHTVTEILRKAPTVIDLTIITRGPDPGGITNKLISNLTLRGLVGSTPGDLRGLFFGCEDESYINYALYLKMLQSRWKAADRVLEAAVLLTISGPGPDSTTTSSLHILRQEGLDLTLLQGTEARRVINRWNLWGVNS